MHIVMILHDLKASYYNEEFKGWNIAAEIFKGVVGGGGGGMTIRNIY